MAISIGVPGGTRAGSKSSETRALLARMEPDRRLLEAHRGVDGRSTARRRRRRDASRRSCSSTGGCVGGRAAAREAGLPGRVEGGAERVVERAQPDLVAGCGLRARADEPRACAPLLGVDDRTQDPLERRRRGGARAGAPR